MDMRRLYSGPGPHVQVTSRNGVRPSYHPGCYIYVSLYITIRLCEYRYYQGTTVDDLRQNGKDVKLEVVGRSAGRAEALLHCHRSHLSPITERPKKQTRPLAESSGEGEGTYTKGG